MINASILAHRSSYTLLKNNQKEDLFMIIIDEICKFVNSKDIADYLGEIEYNFSPKEISWLIYQCKHLNLKEKHKEWEHLIENTFDWPFETSESKEPSLHRFLKRYIETENRYLKEFTNPNESIYHFSVKVVESDDFDYIQTVDCFYSSYENCLQAAKEYCKDYQEPDCKSFRIKMVKKGIDTSDEFKDRLEIYLNNKFEIESIDAYGIPEEDLNTLIAFDCMWFSFPTPFKKGDIICGRHSSPDLCRGPMVLECTAPDWYEKRNRKGRDISDMWMMGYFQSDTGEIYSETSNDNYMDFEYYPLEKLTDKQRVLIALSNYLKGEIDISLMVKAYHQILLEETAHDNMPREFTEEGLKLAGLR